MSAWVSITGIYNYRPDIFDELTLPVKSDIVNDKIEYIDNIEELDRETLINNILFELGELELLYSDPDFLKSMIGVWSRLEKGNWLSIWETMLYKYNPIWNKDGEVVESRELERGAAESASREGTSTTSRTMENVNQGDRTITNNVTGFDSNSFSPNTQNVEHAESSGSGSAEETGTVNSTEESTMSGTEDETIRRVERGNIGVTMTQDMIKQQREIVQFNILEYITQSFKRRFCLMVY